jgi:hypothetical protein
MEVVGIFYAYLVYFVAIWYFLWPFGIFCGHLIYLVFFRHDKTDIDDNFISSNSAYICELKKTNRTSTLKN